MDSPVTFDGEYCGIVVSLLADTTMSMASVVIFHRPSTFCTAVQGPFWERTLFVFARFKVDLPDIELAGKSSSSVPTKLRPQSVQALLYPAERK